MKTRCLLVDDEPLALEILETYLSQLSDFEISAKCTNAIKASDVLREKEIDLIFLDIKMPQFDGIAFLKTIQNPPKVIFTTAYREHALEGFDLNVVDYLLKPISFDRFMKAINKYYQSAQNKQKYEKEIIAGSSGGAEFVYIKSDKKLHKVFLKDIYFLESMEDYVVVQKRDQKIITKDQLKHFEEMLPKDMFIRIHRSYIVSIPKIDAITSETIEIFRRELPIGRSYKQIVWGTLRGRDTHV